jgi:hypothetical protein
MTRIVPRGLKCRGISVTGDFGRFDLVSEGGVGRPFVLLVEAESWSEYARHVYEHLAPKTRVLLVRTPAINDDSWREVSAALPSFLKERGVRQASFVAFGAACAVLQNVCLAEPRFVRAVVFFHGAARAHPSRASRFVDRLESALPLGLPLRLAERGFDGRAFLQRIRCPALVVTPPSATPTEQREAAEMAARMPTAWLIELSATDGPSDVGRLVLEFRDVPAKCPQRGAAV